MPITWEYAVAIVWLGYWEFYSGWYVTKHAAQVKCDAVNRWNSFGGCKAFIIRRALFVVDEEYFNPNILYFDMRGPF